MDFDTSAFLQCLHEMTEDSLQTLFNQAVSTLAVLKELVADTVDVAVLLERMQKIQALLAKDGTIVL